MINLKHSFIIIFVFLLLLLFLVVFELVSVEYKTRQIDSIHNNIQKIHNNFLRLSHINDSFLINKESNNFKQINRLQSQYENLYRYPLTFKFLFIEVVINKNPMLEKRHLLDIAIQEYIKNIKSLYRQQKKLGFNHNSGLYGSFREDVHFLHHSLEKMHKVELELSLYKMRRHEKDFMLRGLTKYVQKYKNEYSSLRPKLKYLNNHTVLQEKVDSYYAKFMKLVEVSEVIGYTNKSDGILQKIVANKTEIDTHFHSLYSELKEEKINLTQNNTFYYSLLGMLFLLLLIQFYIAKTNINNARENNPLTGLNGNRKINDYLKYIAKRKSERLIIYFDFDNFKPFNDRFGFKIGDDAIFIFSEILKKYFAKEKHFIGHIGGDDFIVIIDKANFEKSIKRLYQTVDDFENYAKTFYSDEERKNKVAILKDRFGVTRELPLLSVSAAVIQITEKTVVKNYESISEIISKTKKSSKIAKIAISTILELGK